MELYRNDKVGFWKLEASEEQGLKPDYLEALPRYLNGLDSIFAKAQAQDEARPILSLLGVRGMQAEGWDPYDTTVDAIAAATRLHNETEDRLAARHLSLWIYGHIVEAAAPYDLLGWLPRAPRLRGPGAGAGGRAELGSTDAAAGCDLRTLPAADEDHVDEDLAAVYEVGRSG